MNRLIINNVGHPWAYCLFSAAYQLPVFLCVYLFTWREI